MSYFPAGALSQPPWLDEYATLGLLRFDEPSLYIPTQLWPGVVYRLLYLPVFDERVVIRLTLNGDAGHIIVKRPLRQTEESLWTEERHSLGAEEAQRFQSAIHTADFWNLPTSVSGDYALIRDGYVLILEGRKEAAYHVVGRHLIEDAPLLPVAHTMMRLAGLQNGMLDWADRQKKGRRKDRVNSPGRGDSIPPVPNPTCGGSQGDTGIRD